RSLPHPHLHSFPTRRSSDLGAICMKRNFIPAILFALSLCRPTFAITTPPIEGSPVDTAQKIVRTAGEKMVAKEWKEAAALNWRRDRKSTRLNSSHSQISYAV